MDKVAGGHQFVVGAVVNYFWWGWRFLKQIKNFQEKYSTHSKEMGLTRGRILCTYLYKEQYTSQKKRKLYLHVYK